MKVYKWYEAIELARKEARVFVNDCGERLSWNNFAMRAVVTDGKNEWYFIAHSANLDSDWYDTKDYIEWSEVAVDTKILVKDEYNLEWTKRHFAKFENGKIYAWFDGKTSFTADKYDDLKEWPQAKLYNED